MQASPSQPSVWLHSALWDVCIIAFGWLPFYLVAQTTPLGSVHALPGWDGAFEAALAFVLALNFVHRHYVIVLVYGDPQVFAKSPARYVVAPVLTFALVATVILLEVPWPSELVLGFLGLWNVWHVVRQRYGLMRHYARGAADAHARLDEAMPWCALVAAIAWTLLRHGPSVLLHPLVFPVLGSSVRMLRDDTTQVALKVALALGGLVVLAWLLVEVRALRAGRHPARLLHASSTLALLAVFVRHGPVLGYLCFGLAHSLEYLGYVHAALSKKGRPLSGLSRLLFSRLSRLPLVLAPFLLAYLAARPVWFSLTFTIAYTTTSALHYLYDGWLWRRPAPVPSA